MRVRHRHRICQGCRERHPGSTIEPLGHVCAQCALVVDELAAIRAAELERQASELRSCNAQLDITIAALQKGTR